MTKQELLNIQDRINNPLAIIQGMIDITDDDIPRHEKEAQIQKAINKIVEFVNSLNVTTKE